MTGTPEAPIPVTQEFLDALRSRLCVLDSTGMTVARNAACRESSEHGILASGCLCSDGNYLENCDRSAVAGNGAAARLASSIRSVLEKKEDSLEFEYEAETPEGHGWFLARISHIDKDGQRWVIVSHDDITERKQTELRELEATRGLNELVQSIDGIIWEADAKTFAFSFVSEKARVILGYEPEAWTRSGFWAEKIHPDDRDRAVSLCVEATARLENHEFDYRMVAADGRVVWIHDVVTVVAENGEATKLRGVMFDVTAMRTAEEVRERTEQNLSRLVELSPSPIAVHQDGVIVFCNTATVRVFGGERVDQFIGQSILRFVDPSQHAEVAARSRRVLSEGVVASWQEYVLVRLDGTTFPGEILAGPHTLGGRPAVQILVNDLTEKRKSELDLRESERRFRDLLENVDLLAVALDSDCRVTFCNESLLRLVGRSREEVIGRDWFAEFLPEGGTGIRAAFTNAPVGDTSLRQFENEILALNGERRLVRWSNTFLRDSNGRVLGTSSIGEDVSEQRRAFAAVQESADQYRTMLSATTDGFFLADDRGRLLDVNEPYCRLSGWSRDELLTMSISDVEAFESGSDVAAHNRRIQEKGYDLFETQHRTKSGRLIDVEVSVSPMQSGRFVGFIRDITARKRAERLQHALYEIAEMTASSADLAALFSAIHEILKRLTYARNLYVALRAEGDELRFAYFADEKDPEPPVIAGERSLTRLVFESGTAQLVTSEDADRMIRDGLIADLGSASVDWLGVPLKSEGQPFGVLAVQTYDPSERYDSSDLELFSFVSQNIAAAIERKSASIALSNAQETQRVLLEANPDVAVLLDRSGTILTPSHELQRRLGSELASASIGRNILDFLTDENVDLGRKSLVSVFGTGEVVRFETANRETVWDVVVAPVFDERNEVTRAALFGRDVTENRRAERRIRESEERFRQLVHGLDAIVWETTVEPLAFTFVSRQSESILGYPPEKWLGGIDFWRSIIHPDDVEEALNYCALETSMGHDHEIEYRMIAADGRALWFRDLIHLVKDADGKPVRMTGLFVDITEHKRIEAALSESEQLFRSTFEQAAVGISHTALDGRWLRVNQRNCDILGYSRDELLRMTFHQVSHPDDLVVDLENSQRLLRGETDTYSMDKRLFRKDGSTIWVGLTVSLQRKPTGEPDFFISVVRDITIRKIAEEAKRSAEAHLEQVFDASPLPIIETDVEGRVRMWNAAAERTFGWTQEEVLGAFNSVVGSAERGQYMSLVKRIRYGESTGPTEVRRVRKDGTPLDLSMHAAPILGADAALSGLIMVFEDVTDKRAAERRSRELTAAIENAPDAIYVTDATGTIVYNNPAVQAMTGFSSEEILGATPRLFRSGEHDQWFYRRMFDELKAGRVWRGRFVNRRKDGLLYTEAKTIAPIHDQAGRLTGFVSIGHDATAQDAMEGRLRESQRMESIGQLAGGVAHDFNNVLQAMFSYLDFAGEAVAEKAPDALADIQEARKAADRAASLTRQLLAFSRRQYLDLQHLSVNDVVSNILKMVRRVIGENISLSFEPHEDLPPVFADPAQLEQVILNLCINARDAMPRGGALQIHTAVRVVTRDEERTDSFEPGEYAILTVRDSGTGIAPDVVGRIFEPFFTTKTHGRGSGLGLSTVYGIVHQHQGFIEVETALGKGSAFHVFLPVDRSASIAVDSPDVLPESVGGEETILFAEDEPSIRDVTQRALSAAGYTVLTAADGVEALALFVENRGTIDLVILDAIMPRKSGREVLGAIREVDTAIPVVFCSGYSAETLATGSALDESMELISKPFDMKHLLVRIRAILDARKGS